MTATTRSIDDRCAASEPAARQYYAPSLALSLIVVLASTLAHFRSESFRRGMGPDELITLQNYTWAGVHADGTRRELARIDDVESLPTCSLRQFVIGCYCSLGRWTEPNNHVYHSLCTNFSLVVVRPTIVAIRLPSLLATAIFALLCAYLCCWAGWYVAAPLIAALACWHPYLVTMSQSSRGYALSLLLTTLWLALLIQLVKQPRSVWINCAMAATAMAIIQNMVNLLVNWVVPVYVILLVAPRWFCAAGCDNAQIVTFRRNLGLQLLAVMAVACVFFMDRLPYVYSSATQYGFPIASFDGGLRELLKAAQYLFPRQLGALAVLAMAGFALALRQRATRVIPAIYGFALLVSLLYFFVTSRFPYQRNFGVFLPLFWFGFAAAIQASLRLAGRSRVASAVVLVLSLVLTGWWMQPGYQLDLRHPEFDALTDYVSRAGVNIGPRALVVRGRGVASPVQLHYPSGWSETEIPRGNEPIQLVVIESKTFPFSLSHATSDDHVSLLADWPATVNVDLGPYSIRHCSAIVQAAVPARSTDAIRLAIWSPPFELVALSPEPALAALQRTGLRFHGVEERYQAKLEVFSRLKSVWIDTEHVRRGGEYFAAVADEVAARLRNLQQRLGGRLVFLTPCSGTENAAPTGKSGMLSTDVL